MATFPSTGLFTSCRIGHIHSPFNAILLPAMPKYSLLQRDQSSQRLNSGFSFHRLSISLTFFFFLHSVAVSVSLFQIRFHTFIYLHVNRGFLASLPDTQAIKIIATG